MQTPIDLPFYLNWTFWAFIISVIAVFLSQLPPVRLWFKKTKLETELYSRISLTHQVGNPNIQAHIIVRNTGGRTLRIRKITMTLVRDGKLLVEFPVQNYQLNEAVAHNLLFTGFSIQPSEEWGHIINCLNYFNREDEKKYRQLELDLKKDIESKLQTKLYLANWGIYY